MIAIVASVRNGLLLAGIALLTGCVSFGGPKDVELAITKASDVELDLDQGVRVGPLGIFLIQVVAGPSLPVSLDGVSSVEVGSYRVTSLSAAPFSVDDLVLPGWERIVRVREEGASTVIMVDEDGESIRGFLVLHHDDDRLDIVRARGRLDRTLESAMELAMSEEWDCEGYGGGDWDGDE